jgi:CRAL/TRIO domain
MIQRFLEGNQWKQKEAFQQILQHHQFVNSFPIELNAFKVYEEELNKGYCYVYKRDKCFRPVFVLDVAKLKQCKIPHETVLQMSTYFIQFLINRALIPGRVENWVSIVDMKGVGITEVPKNLMKAITKPLQQYFKGRLYRLHVINAKWTIKIVWKVVKKVVDPLTVLKFVVCEDDFSKDLFKLIDPDNLEKRFGGNLPDKRDNFFPPQLI